ncbi:MAG: hypothetical protein JW839_18285 [Candidatus Lokiarchaeota archaeon]|nr:hypothetical protein [Candidatus Lokiarchaeota archaeon]
MGFVSTIAYMLVAGFVVQLWYRRSLRARWKDAKFFIGNVIIAATWILQYLVYIDVLPLPAVLSAAFPWIPPQSGRTWMWNSWQFWQFGGGQALLDIPAGMSQVAVMLALSYPLWYFLGIWIGRCAFGNKSYQHGALWLFSVEKGSAPAPRLEPGDGEGEPEHRP